MFYKGKQKPENIANIIINDQIQSVYYNENYVGLVFYNAGGETTHMLQLYDTAGNKGLTLYFDQEYKDIMLEKEGIIIYNEDECVIFDWEGRKKYEGFFKEKIECVIPLGNIARYVIVTNTSVQMIKLQ